MFEKGDIVVDDVRQRLGEVMETTTRAGKGPVLVLRPPRGGVEWEQMAIECREPEPHELVSADALKIVEAKP